MSDSTFNNDYSDTSSDTQIDSQLSELLDIEKAKVATTAQVNHWCFFSWIYVIPDNYIDPRLNCFQIVNYLTWYYISVEKDLCKKFVYIIYEINKNM